MRTTTEAAKAVGISRASLQEWIRVGKVNAPKLKLQDGRAVRFWTETDIVRLKALKERIYRKGRGRKPKAKP